jgi:hypothetical protein
MLGTTLQRLRRRWYVAVIGLLVTVGLGFVAASLVPSRYSTTTEVVLLPPHPEEGARDADSSSQLLDNPYLGIAGLAGMADVVSRAMMDEASVQAMKKAGVTGTYTIQRDVMAAAPILMVKVENSQPSTARKDLEVVAKEVPLVVARLQADSSIAQASRITLAEVSRPSAPVRSGKAQVRALGLALVGGLVLTVLAVAVLDAWSLRRRRGAVSADPGAITEAVEPEADPAEPGALLPGGANDSDVNSRSGNESSTA